MINYECFLILTTFWYYLWSTTEQMHNNMKSICLPFNSQFRESCVGSTKYPQVDISLYSYHLSAWNFKDIVGRNSVLNTHRGWRLKRHRTKRSSSIKRLVVKAPKFVSPLASGHLYQATVITFAVSPNVLFVLSSTCSDRNYSNKLGMIF